MRLEMNCPLENSGDPDVLLAHVAGSLSFPETSRLEEHLRGCEACRDFVQAQQSVWRALDEWDAPAVTPGFDSRLYERIERERAGGWWQRAVASVRPLLLRPAFAGVAACLLVFAGLLLQGPGGTVSPAGQAQVEALEAEQVERALDDVEMLRELDLGAAAVTPVRSM
jgi:anti-sigma factor RsiW